MSFNVYSETTGAKLGAFPGTTLQTEDNLGIKPASHTDVIRFESRLHAALDPATGAKKSNRVQTPTRLTFKFDQNYARWMSALLSGEELTINLVFAQQVPGGGLDKSLTLKYKRVTVADVVLVTGKAGVDSGGTSIGRGETDTSELYEVSFMYAECDGDSGNARADAAGNGKGAVPFSDYWSRPGQG